MSEETTTTPVADVSTSVVTDAASTPVGDVAGEVTAEETLSAVESTSQMEHRLSQMRAETRKQNLRIRTLPLSSILGMASTNHSR